MNMESYETESLEKDIKTLRVNLQKLAEDQDLEELINTIRRPGWTTPAEFRLVRGLTKGLIDQTNALLDMKTSLVEGSRAVEVKQ